MLHLHHQQPSPPFLRCHFLLSSVRKVSRALLHPQESVSRSRRIFSTIRYMTLSSTLGLSKGHKRRPGQLPAYSQRPQGWSLWEPNPLELAASTGLGAPGIWVKGNPLLIPTPHSNPKAAPLTGALCYPRWRWLVSEEHCYRPGCCCHRKEGESENPEASLLTVFPLITHANVSTCHSLAV